MTNVLSPEEQAAYDEAVKEAVAVEVQTISQMSPEQMVEYIALMAVHLTMAYKHIVTLSGCILELQKENKNAKGLPFIPIPNIVGNS